MHAEALLHHFDLWSPKREVLEFVSLSKYVTKGTLNYCTLNSWPFCWYNLFCVSFFLFIFFDHHKLFWFSSFHIFFLKNKVIPLLYCRWCSELENNFHVYKLEVNKNIFYIEVNKNLYIRELCPKCKTFLNIFYTNPSFILEGELRSHLFYTLELQQIIIERPKKRGSKTRLMSY